MTNLSQNLVASATRRPDSVALRCDDQTYTYAQFDDAAARVATLLRQAYLRRTKASIVICAGIALLGIVAGIILRRR